MKLSHTLAAWSVAALLLATGTHALAGEGHDHGEAPAPAAGPALPRFTATSELFELVGVLNGRQLSLYLDHFADNSPVKDARLELQFDGKEIKVEPHADGEFEAVLEEALEPGVVAVTATVFAGENADLLAGELDLHEEGGETGDEAQQAGREGYAVWLGAGALVLGFAGWIALRKRGVRSGSTGGAA